MGEILLIVGYYVPKNMSWDAGARTMPAYLGSADGLDAAWQHASLLIQARGYLFPVLGVVENHMDVEAVKAEAVNIRLQVNQLARESNGI
jgi:hypothetical protein